MNTDYRHLNVDERAFIQLALERSCTLRAIARSVQRAPSTISRELAVTLGSDRPNVVAEVDRGWPVATVLCRLRSGRFC